MPSELRRVTSARTKLTATLLASAFARPCRPPLREFRYRARPCLLEVDDLRPRRGDGDAHHLPVHVATPGQPAVPLIGWHKSGLHLQVLVRDAVDRFQARGTPHQQYLGWMVGRVYRQRDLWIRFERLDFRGVGGGAHHHLTSVPQEPDWDGSRRPVEGDIRESSRNRSAEQPARHRAVEFLGDVPSPHRVRQPRGRPKASVPA